MKLFINILFLCGIIVAACTDNVTKTYEKATNSIIKDSVQHTDTTNTPYTSLTDGDGPPPNVSDTFTNAKDSNKIR